MHQKPPFMAKLQKQNNPPSSGKRTPPPIPTKPVFRICSKKINAVVAAVEVVDGVGFVEMVASGAAVDVVTVVAVVDDDVDVAVAVDVVVAVVAAVEVVMLLLLLTF